MVASPDDVMLVFDGSGWHLEPAPPVGWFEAMEDLLERDELRAREVLVPALAEVRHLPCLPAAGRGSSCRPGPGPCRRPHVHASGRRAA